MDKHLLKGTEATQTSQDGYSTIRENSKRYSPVTPISKEPLTTMLTSEISNAA